MHWDGLATGAKEEQVDVEFGRDVGLDVESDCAVRLPAAPCT